MADTKFVDNYVLLLRNQGNDSVYAWKTPTGAIYYSDKERETPTTTVGRVSTEADTTTADTEVSTSAPTETASKTAQAVRQPLVQDDGVDTSDNLPDDFTSSVDLGSLFGEDAPKSTEELLEQHQQYQEDVERQQDVKDFLASTKGKIAQAVAPAATAVGSLVYAGPAALRTSAVEQHAEETYDNFTSTMDDLFSDPNISDEDFWDQAEKAIDEYDIANTGQASGQGQLDAGSTGDEDSSDSSDYGSGYSGEAADAGTDETSGYAG